MTGISSKALNGSPENKYKYNGIEKENDLQIEIYDAHFRELDAQVARWWQIDPITYGYETVSPYASMYNNPITITDPLGNEGEECCRDFFNAIGNAVEDVLISASGVVNGALNTVSFGIISSDPFGMRDKLSGDKLDLYNNSVTVGKVGPLFIPGGARAKTPPMELVPVGGKGPTPVSVETQPLTPTVTPFAQKNNSNSSSNANKNTSQNQAKQSKVEKSTKTESVGNGKYTKTTEVKPGYGPGQSRAEYIKYKNKDGKTIKVVKDSYDRGNKFQHRKIKLPASQ